MYARLHSANPACPLWRILRMPRITGGPPASCRDLSAHRSLKQNSLLRGPASSSLPCEASETLPNRKKEKLRKARLFLGQLFVAAKASCLLPSFSSSAKLFTGRTPNRLSFLALLPLPPLPVCLRISCPPLPHTDRHAYLCLWSMYSESIHISS